MNDGTDSLFSGGIPNRKKCGRAIYHAAGDGPDSQQIELAAKKLGRQARFADSEGYECEIIGAAVDCEKHRVAYVESRAKQLAQYVDITITLFLWAPHTELRESEIESYNPFFGCDVRFFQWWDDTVILIYREKHKTYLCRFGFDFPAQYLAIEDCWVINGSILGFQGYKETEVRRLTLPDLKELEHMSEKEAQNCGLLPTKFW